MIDRKIKLVVAGDISFDTLIWPINGWETDKAKPIGTTKVVGDALLLAEFLRQKINLDVLSPKFPDVGRNQFFNQHLSIDFFPKNSVSKEKVYRIKAINGTEVPNTGKTIQLGIDNDDGDEDIVVLYDAGQGFIQEHKKWPVALRTEGENPIIILRMSMNNNSLASLEYLPEKCLDKTVIILDANELREFGINISRCLSWERTAMDLKWQFRYNHKLSPLLKCRHIVVMLGLEGGVCFNNEPGNLEATLIYDPLEMEDGYASKFAGEVLGMSPAFVAVFSAEISEGLLIDRTIKDSVKIGTLKGLNACRDLLRSGYKDQYGKPEYDLKAIMESKNDDIDRLVEVNIPDSSITEESDANYWCIVKKLDGLSIDKIAEDIVAKGQGAILSKVPSARFGKLCTIDRTEIESFRSISNLMSEYLKGTNNPRPLSIAVFGSPGSGKSFGVTEIAESLAPGQVVKLEFNISQFTAEVEFASAFHKVRDVVLKGKMPLVFFDEFDAAYKGRLGWLKSLLAPMQDGVFKEGESMHPIGNAIFVFAGGTSSSFEAFCGDYIDEGKKKDWQEEFINAKGPDFVSRLRGFVNIMGPNPVTEEDSIYIIRRAMLLRSLLERKAGKIFDREGKARIDAGILSALLHIGKYNHGARSMEALIDMSMLESKNCWEAASLPIREQLSIHVDSDVFLRYVAMDVLLSAAREKIARSVHDEYLKSKIIIEGEADHAHVPYDKLTESLKDSCRASAEDIFKKLQIAGLGIRPAKGEAKIFEFKLKDIDIMSKEEHERFVKERITGGWKSGPVKDVEQKVSPYLIPWDELEDSIKELDRSAVRNIPKLLASAGFEIYRIV